MNSKAIGGYFELELPQRRNSIHQGAIRVQSARSAFLALLRAGRPARVWMPRYLCETMYAPLRDAGIELLQYSIDKNFRILEKPMLESGDWLYYVNYFGVCEEQVDALIECYGRERVIVDNCQAFYSQPRECLATIFSPRKFFGVPDGGLLLTEIAVELPSVEDHQSLARATHLLQRLASTPEAGYVSYKMAEQTLEELEPKRMSKLTDALLSTVDFETIRLKRNQNFAILHEKLGAFNECKFDAQAINGALCYPLLIDSPGLRKHLIASRIFVATYWPDVLERIGNTTVEATLVKNLLPLPCDQRYGHEDMLNVAEICLEFISSKNSFKECE